MAGVLDQDRRLRYWKRKALQQNSPWFLVQVVSTQGGWSILPCRENALHRLFTALTSLITDATTLTHVSLNVFHWMYFTERISLNARGSNNTTRNDQRRALLRSETPTDNKWLDRAEPKWRKPAAARDPVGNAANYRVSTANLICWKLRQSESINWVVSQTRLVLQIP